MCNILIVATGGDAHANAVTWGLRQLGLRPVMWDWSKFPSSEDAQLSLPADGAPGLRFGAEGAMHAGPFDVIWWRRPGKPTAPPAAHPDDRPVIERQSERFLESILPFAAHAGTRWINEPAAERMANNKARQLVLARQLGFRIPHTLMGTNPAAVRAFLAEQGGTLAHKGFLPMFWENGDGSATASRTAPVGAAHLASDFAVRACPSIYQELLPKQCELRVTVMGERVLAVRIDSQRYGPTIDWRCDSGHGADVFTGTELGRELAARCVRLCRELGLQFGCIDLVVTPADEVVFLEVNPAGQFLFPEIADPSIRALDAFCRFLAGIDDVAGAPALSLQACFDAAAAREREHA